MRVFDRRTAGQKSVGLHPEGSVTGQIDQIFLRFSSVLEQILGWYPKFTLHGMLVMQPLPESTSKSSPKHRPPKAIKISSHRCPLNTNSFQIPSPAAYSQQSVGHYLNLVFFQTFYLAKSLSFPEGREAALWEPSEQ